MHINKVGLVIMIAAVAEDFMIDEVWLPEVANEMGTEDSRIWIYGIDDDETLAFTVFGIEKLRDLVRVLDDCLHWLKCPE